MIPLKPLSWVGAVLGMSTAVASSALSQAQEPSIYAITGVHVVDIAAGTILRNQTVVIQGDRIVSVETAGRAPADASAIDASGKFLIPGLWDMHVHLRHPLAPDLLMPQFIANGVTGVREMGSDCEEPAEGRTCLAEMRRWQNEIETGELLGPRLLALSSFALNPPWDYDVTEEQMRELIQRFKTQAVDVIKIYYRMAPDDFRLLMREAKRHGLAVGGHIPIRMTATEVSTAGLHSLEHARDFLFDCFPGSAEFRSTTQSQNPPMGVMRSMVNEHDADQCSTVFQTFVRNGTWYVPTHVTRRMDAYADDPTFRNDPRAKYVPANAWQAWQADADRMVALDSSPAGRETMRGFYEKGLEITGRAHAAGVNIVLGTDAGDTYVFPGSSVHDELGELVKAGLTPAEALRAATLRAAEFLELEEEYGTVTPGKRADLLLLNGNPLRDIAKTREIHTLFFNGRVFTRSDLDDMLRRVAAKIADPN